MSNTTLLIVNVDKVFADSSSIGLVARNASGILKVVAVAIAVLVLLATGISMLMANLNGVSSEIAVSSAKRKIVAVAIGLGIVYLAPVVVSTIQNVTTMPTYETAREDISGQNQSPVGSSWSDFDSYKPKQDGLSNEDAQNPADVWFRRLEAVARGNGE